MKRKIKIGSHWLSVSDLKTLVKLLEKQQTSDKDDIGMYAIWSDESIIHYRVTLDYDIILDRTLDYDIILDRIED